jgi:ligand-binding sensor domain-containing protein
MIRTQTHRRRNVSRFRPFFFVLLLSVCPVAVTGHAQEHGKAPETPLSNAWGHKAWSSENGLPQNSVHRILQTRNGYLWVATEGGVARFNGLQFTIFNQESEPAFTSNDTCCLAEDRSGGLWIGTAAGLLR